MNYQVQLMEKQHHDLICLATFKPVHQQKTVHVIIDQWGQIKEMTSNGILFFGMTLEKLLGMNAKIEEFLP